VGSFSACNLFCSVLFFSKMDKFEMRDSQTLINKAVQNYLNIISKYDDPDMLYDAILQDISKLDEFRDDLAIFALTGIAGIIGLLIQRTESSKEKFDQVIGYARDYMPPSKCCKIYIMISEACYECKVFDYAYSTSYDAMAIARKNALIELEVKAQKILAALCNQTGKYQEALVHIRDAINLLTDVSSIQIIPQLLLERARIHCNMGDYTSSLNSLDDIEKSEQLLSDPILLGEMMLLRADIYRRIGDFNKANTLFEKYLEITSEVGQRGDSWQALFALGNYTIDMGDYEHSMTNFKKCLIIAANRNRHYLIPIIRIKYADASVLAGNYIDALNEYIAAVEAIAESLNWYILELTHILGQIYFVLQRLGRKDHAKLVNFFLNN